MQTRNDAELLREYAARQSEAAFGEIVRRYADVVYSAALRQVGDAEQARDVAQTVFVDLARKAGSIPPNTLLVGWLHRGARLAALEQLRKDQRRQQRERQAMESLDAAPETPADWDGVRPVLDDAIATLGHEDRDALLLRFFRNESLSAVGAALGVSEDAAQKRVSRALDKLREILAGRGIRTTAAALSAVLVANAVQSAPAGFAASLAAGAFAGAAAAGSVAVPAAKLFAWTQTKAVVVALATAVGLAGLLLVHVQSRRELRDTRATVRQLTQEIEGLQADNARLANLTNALEQLRGDPRDVLRLRAEVAQLRRDLAERRAAASVADPTTETNRMPEPSPRQIHVSARFTTVPARFAPNDTEGILTVPEFKSTSEALEKLDGATILGEPQVTTLSGRQAQVMAGPSMPVGGGYSNVGLLLDVTPTCWSNSPMVNLDVVLQLTKLADTGSPPANLPPGVPATAITNSIQIWDGQTLVLTRRISANEQWPPGDAAGGSTEPRSLLVFVTPTIVDPAGNRLNLDDEPQAAPPASSLTVRPGAIPQSPSVAAEPETQ